MLLTSRQITSGLSWIVKHQVSAENWRIASSGKTHTHWSTEVFNVWWSGWKQGAFHNTYQFSSVSQSCLTLCDLMDCSPPGSSVHGILEAEILEWVAMPFSRGSSQPRNRTQVSQITGRFFTVWATREAHGGTYANSVVTSPVNCCHCILNEIMIQSISCHT